MFPGLAAAFWFVSWASTQPCATSCLSCSAGTALVLSMNWSSRRSRETASALALDSCVLHELSISGGSFSTSPSRVGFRRGRGLTASSQNRRVVSAIEWTRVRLRRLKLGMKCWRHEVHDSPAAGSLSLYVPSLLLSELGRALVDLLERRPSLSAVLAVSQRPTACSGGRLLHPSQAWAEPRGWIAAELTSRNACSLRQSRCYLFVEN